ncbi:ABC transporter permease subunit [Methyloprofundus sp.]|uniref:ABC transporter permease subunit n=1 Tax=Methyloprofundus sp. TaxID=2020875 RepID=UPI003D12E926
MTPGFLRHLALICQFELKRFFTTRKGLLYLITFALIWYFILLYPIRYAADFLGQQQNSLEGNSIFQFIGFGSLLNWKLPELGVYWHFSLILFPLLTVMSSADQTSSDRERGTLRFLSLRVSRDSLFFGRFSGAILTQSILVLASLLSTLALITYRDPALLPLAFDSATAIFLSLVIVLLPFTAMMSALSATVQSARQVTVWAILIWSVFAWIISIFSAYLPALNNLKLLIPGYQMSALSQLAEWQTLQLAYIPLLQTIALLIIGRWIMHRQSL